VTFVCPSSTSAFRGRAVRRERVVTALDGNAIAGPLQEVFGVEMTVAMGTCAGCGATARVAELVVYMRGPGVVGRCRRCDSVLIVLVTIRGRTCVDLRGLAALGLPQASSSSGR
jgi:hypothetical protein